MARHDYETLWAVVRLDLVPIERVRKDPQLFVTIKAVVPNENEAKSEVDRLKALPVAQSGVVLYFATPTRYFAEGREVQVDY